MSTTQAQAAVMEQTAARFEQVNNVLRGVLARLLAELEVLQSAWVGAGGSSFQQVKTAWAEDQGKLHHALAETAAAIRSSGRQYQLTDHSAADRFGPGRRSLTLPL